MIFSGAATHVRLGEHDENIVNEYRRDVKVAEIIPYPQYQYWEDLGRKYKYDDIGLLRLEGKVQFTDAIRPACLPEEPITSVNATATGWGSAEINKPSSSILMKVKLDIFDYNTCSDANPVSRIFPQGIQNETQFCAGSATSTKNTCSGDSGGSILPCL